jgi:hypothetical protein
MIRWPTLRDAGVESVWVAGQVVPVEFTDDFPGESNTFGQFDCQEMCITIKNGLRSREQWRTLAHERLHALAYISGWTFLSEKEEESLAQAVAADTVSWIETTKPDDMLAALLARYGVVRPLDESSR